LRLCCLSAWRVEGTGNFREANSSRGVILCENRFNLTRIFKAILATLERIIRLFSLKWLKSPFRFVLD
jgi:hypothetical protein